MNSKSTGTEYSLLIPTPSTRTIEGSLPCVKLLYEVEQSGTIVKSELPFVIGVLADFQGHYERQRLRERAFLTVDRDNFADVMRQCDVRLRLQLPRDKSATKSLRTVEVRFESLADFEPAGMIRQLESSAPTSIPAGASAEMLVHFIFQHPDFLKLEGTWRGLDYLLSHSALHSLLRVKILNVSIRELALELNRVPEVDESSIYAWIVNEPYRPDCPEPFGLLIGDYELSHQPPYLDLLRQMAELGAAACCPFVTGAAPELWGLSKWEDINSIRDLSRRTLGPDHAAWNQFRDSAEARYVVLTGPRTVARFPWRWEPEEVTHFDAKSTGDDTFSPPPLRSASHCWMNTAFVLGAYLGDEFQRRGLWVTLGADVDSEAWDFDPRRFLNWDDDARIKDLPRDEVWRNELEPMRISCTEIAVTSRREDEFRQSGVLTLCDNGFAAAFRSLPTCQRFESPELTVNAVLAANLAVVLTNSRFAQYVKVIFKSSVKCPDQDFAQQILNVWLCGYVNGSGPPSPETWARFPLADARGEIRDDLIRPGRKVAVLWLQPWLDKVSLTGAVQTAIALD